MWDIGFTYQKNKKWEHMDWFGSVWNYYPALILLHLNLGIRLFKPGGHQWDTEIPGLKRTRNEA